MQLRNKKDFEIELIPSQSLSFKAYNIAAKIHALSFKTVLNKKSTIFM